MPSRKRYNHAKIGANLRAAGLLPKGYRLDRLTKNQKDRIIKIRHQHPGPALHPGEFVGKKINWKDARTLKRAGYEVKLSGKRPTVAFARYGAEKISYRKGEVVRHRGHYKTRTRVGDSRDIFDQAREFFARKKKGQTLMLRVGSNSAFGVAIDNYEDFVKYMHHWRARYGSEAWEGVRDHLYVIEADKRYTRDTRAA
jgi:hypothetical protein